MAMNKAEKAMLEEALRQAAFRRTAPIQRDVPAPRAWSAGYTEGWDFNSYSLEVLPRWSSCVGHGSGPAPAAGARHISGSQGGRDLFSTKERALQAMRWEVEEKAATDLRKIDRAIEAARATGGATHD
jgi:hypothetical protein